MNAVKPSLVLLQSTVTAELLAQDLRQLPKVPGKRRIGHFIHVLRAVEIRDVHHRTERCTSTQRVPDSSRARTTKRTEGYARTRECAGRARARAAQTPPSLPEGAFHPMHCFTPMRLTELRFLNSWDANGKLKRKQETAPPFSVAHRIRAHAVAHEENV